MADKFCDDGVVDPSAQRYHASASGIFENRPEEVYYDNGGADDKYQFVLLLRDDLIDENAIDTGGGDAEKGCGQ